MTAHLTKTKSGFELTISPTVRQADFLYSFPVSGKREARTIAKKFNAQPWNF